jgi:hypothetical protein
LRRKQMRNDRVLGTLTFATAALVSAGCAVQTPVSGFRPVYPDVTASFGNRAPDFLDWTKVDSLQPTLRWQAFPGEHQRFAGGQVTPFVAVDPTSVRDVRYDLRIWTVRGRSPGDLVYEIDGLTEPSYKAERPLQPDTEYYWSVRARFRLDGEPRASEWSLSQVPCPPPYGLECARGVARQTGRIPPPNYYRFKTPTQ